MFKVAGGKMAVMQPSVFLRVEGLIVLIVALFAYFQLNGPLWILIVFALAPDISMLGYLVSNRIGSLSYNMVHTYAVPLSIGVVGYWAELSLILLITLIWIGHIGVDRFVGYGLIYQSGFKDTHLSIHSQTTK